jgi:hypothetical protein
MEIEETIIEYFEVNDGEYFCIQQKDNEEDEEPDQLLMTRADAIDLANDIWRIFGNKEFNTND